MSFWKNPFRRSSTKLALIPLGEGRLVPRQHIDDLLRISVVERKFNDVRALIAAGADVNSTNDAGETVLILAAQMGETACLRALIGGGAEVNAKDKDGNTALMQHDAHPEIVAALKAAGADVNLKNRVAETALMLAAENGQLERVKALIAAGADVNAKDKEGRTAIEKVLDNTALMKAKGPEIAAALKAAGIAPLTPPPTLGPGRSAKAGKLYSKKGNVELVPVPGGEVTLGGNEEDLKPLRSVFLDSYLISKTPVTVAEFKTYCTDKRIDFSTFKKPFWGWIDDHPMVNVSWEQARDFCLWAGGDLPTEAQWEIAARGTDGRKYPWGNEWDPSLLQWSSRGLGTAGGTSPVFAHPRGASPYGCLDMAGNVWEWCLDWYEKHPVSPTAGEWHTWRGGSWALSRPASFRCAYKYPHVTAYHRGANHTYDDFGFRLAAFS